MKKLFVVFFALYAGINFTACSGDGKGSVVSPDCYEYKLLDDGTVSIWIHGPKVPKSFIVPAEIEGYKVSKVDIYLDGQNTVTVSEGIKEFGCGGKCKKLVLADSIKRMYIAAYELESINIPKGITKLVKEYDYDAADGQARLELYSPQMKELIIPAHVTAVYPGGIKILDAYLNAGSSEQHKYENCKTQTEKITFENPNVKFYKKVYSDGDYLLPIELFRYGIDKLPLKLQAQVKELQNKSEEWKE